MCMINQDKCSEALLFASVKHEGQKMKQPSVSYVAHLQGVCIEAVSGCLNSGESVDMEKVIVLSLLHDTLEDTDTKYEEIERLFGKEIADGVLSLTKNMSLDKEYRMIDSIKRIKEQSREVAIVKMADRIFNLKDVPNEWNYSKVNDYRNEAILIYNELGKYNTFMASRLMKRINAYKGGVMFH